MKKTVEDRVYVCRWKQIAAEEIRINPVILEQMEDNLKGCRECEGLDDDCREYIPQIKGGFFIIRGENE